MNTKSHHHLCAVSETGRVIERVIAESQIDSLLLESSRAQERFALFIDGLCRNPGHLSADQIQQRETRLRLARVTVYQAKEAA
jgi:hypothetical protein